MLLVKITVLQPGKMHKIGNEVIKGGLDVAALQEIRWEGNGRIDKKHYTVIYIGSDGGTGQCGTGFIINKIMKKSLSGVHSNWRPHVHSPR